MTLSIMIILYHLSWLSCMLSVAVNKPFILSAIMQNVVILSVASLLKKTTHVDSKLVNRTESIKLILSIVMLSVAFFNFMLTIGILNVIILSVVGHTRFCLSTLTQQEMNRLRWFLFKKRSSLLLFRKWPGPFIQKTSYYRYLDVASYWWTGEAFLG